MEGVVNKQKSIGLARIEAPYFIAGIEFSKDTKTVVTRAAPIIKYMIGWSPIDVKTYCLKKKWRIKWRAL